jgi:hypothetical protein
MLAPVLTLVAKKGSSHAAPMEESTDTAWPWFSLELFTTVDQVDRLNNSLFAGAGLPLAEDSSGRLRLKSPEECAADILTAFTKLQNDLAGLQQRLGGKFL